MLVRDPVHGDVTLGPLETAVLDLPELQRMRGIKQLGTAHLVYPGCVHTRFDHSLGACAVAHRILDGLAREGFSIPTSLRELVGAATLLHDVTHIPFGHTLEDERRLFPRHDKGERLATLLAGPLGARLQGFGAAGEIAALLGADGTDVPGWAREIVSSTIDADLLDYLRRDSYFAGLAQNYDDRIFRYFTIADDRLALNMTKHGMERPDARSEIVQILRMRYFLTERVYYHHTKVAAGAMVSKAVELALDASDLSEAELLHLNDWTLLDRLLRAPQPAVAHLADRLERRDLLKRGYVISANTVPPVERAELVRRYHESRRTRREAESTLAAAVGCAPGEVIIYCPALTVMKEAAALVQTPNGLQRLNDTEHAPASETRAIEERYARLWRFYAFAPAAAAARVAPAAAELFGYESEYEARESRVES